MSLNGQFSCRVRCRFQHKRERGLSLKGEKWNRSKHGILLGMLGISSVFQSNRKLWLSDMASNPSASADLADRERNATAVCTAFQNSCKLSVSHASIPIRVKDASP